MGRRKPKSEWEQDRETAMDGLFASMQQAGSDDLGMPVSVGSDSLRDAVGLPLPALCLRYLYQATVMPLSRITQIAGTEGCCKTALLYEMFRWHLMYGGGVVLTENEGKDAADLRHSIYQWDKSYVDRTLVAATASVNEWQKVWTHYISNFSKQQTADGGPGRTFPVIFGLDSLTATSTDEEQQTIDKEGSASRGYPLMAQLITRYMRTMPKRLQGFPFSVVGTNHLKPGTDQQGRPKNTIPGGMSVKFMETCEIIMKRAPGAYDIDRADCQGLRLLMKMQKNSAGPSRRQLQVDFLWWFAEHPETGEWVQYSAWDWDTATVELLFSFENVSGKKTLFNALRDVTGIRSASRSQRTAYSELLGIPKGDPQHYRVVAEALESRQDILEEVYKLLGVLKKNEFTHGVDYLRSRQAAEAEACQAAAGGETRQLLPLVDGEGNPEFSPEADITEAGDE